jgi:hypothetical protein
MRDMAKALGLQGTGLAEIGAADSLLIARTTSPVKGVELSIANSLWAREGVDFNRDFLGRNDRCYRADVRSINFASAEAPAQAGAADIMTLVHAGSLYGLRRLDLAADLDNGAYALGASLMAFVNAHPVAFRPPAVAVHDDGDVPGQSFHVYCR